jgi:protein-S-isoprenylcysteine O-methyltransferase Ste14
MVDTGCDHVSEGEVMAGQQADVAGVVAPPPFFFGIPLVAGLLLNRALPLRWLPRSLSRPLGLVLVGLSLPLVGSAFRALAQAGTHVRPDRPTTALVTAGPFAYSRNPIYLALALVYTGLAAFANALWPLLFLPAVIFGLQRGVIGREERYLERKFADEYRAYRARVRRWL